MSVEFPPGSAPEEPPEEHLDLSGRSRGRDAWILVVLVAGVAIWALTRPPHSPSSSSSPVPSPPVPAPSQLAEPAPSASTLPDPACAGLAGCVVRVDVPAPITKLAHAYLPSGARLRVRTVVAPGARPPAKPFIAREIDAHVDSVTVLMRLQRGGSNSQEIAPDPLGVGSLLLHHVTSGFVVRLQYLAPETVPPMIGRLQALIRDPRLTSS